MKRLIFILLMVSFVFAFGSEDTETILLLNHPTKGILQNIANLVEKNLISIPGLKIIGIYNNNHTYNYTGSEKYLRENNIDYVVLEGYDFNLNPDELFTHNDLSCDFYELFNRSDGIIFPGGVDIPPSVYGEKTHLLTSILEYERLYELSFLYHLAGGSQNESFVPFLNERPDYVILGICLGIQNMAVAAGGTLIQDIPTEIYNHHTYEDLLQAGEERHKNYWGKISYISGIPSFTVHGIRILPDSKLNLLNSVKGSSPFNVISIHHQSVDKPGKNYSITARSTDGKVIEAIEHIKYPHVIGIQFHPELRSIYDHSYTFRSHPEDTLKTIQDLLTKRDLSFHKEFWTFFSRMF
jgi:putative glutamine amidotransferase